MVDDELRGMFEALREEMGELREGLRAEMRAGNEALREEMAGLRDGLRAEMRAGDEALRAEMRAGDDTLRALIAAEHIETRRHIDVVNEATYAKIQLLTDAVQLVHEDLRRTETRLDENIHQTAMDTQALITYSYSELGRRVEALER